MPRNVKIWGIAVGVAACVFGTAAAFAQDTPARVRGTLDKMDGNNLTIQTRSGKETTVTLKDGAPVVAVTKGAMSDIKSNTFVGITAMAQPDGTIKAVEVHVFEESMRGMGEGTLSLGPNAQQHDDQWSSYPAGPEGGRKHATGEIQGRREDNRCSDRRRNCQSCAG